MLGQMRERQHYGNGVNFHWDDPLLLDRQLSDEERMIRDAARDYAQDKLAPRVVEHSATSNRP